MSELRYFSAAELASLVSLPECVDILDSALRTGVVDPEVGSPRLFSELGAGEFILMPAEVGGADSGLVGIKVITAAPGNTALGKPKIQGVYALFDASDLRPLALMDAAELTLLRTPAISALAVRHLLQVGVVDLPGKLSDLAVYRDSDGPGVTGNAPSIRSDDSVQPAAMPGFTRPAIGRLAVLGTGPQAIRHIQAVTGVVDVAEVVVIGRRPEAAARVLAALGEQPYELRAGDHSELPAAKVIVCATSSSVPVLADSDVSADAVVCAMGTHGLDRREIPAELARRSDIFVEGRDSAMREGGNLIPARSVAEWAELPVTNLAELVAGDFERRPGRPALFSGVGMAWEDIVVAGLAYRRSAVRN